MYHSTGFILCVLFLFFYIQEGYAQTPVQLKGDCSGQGATCDANMVCQYGTCRAKIGTNCKAAHSNDECVQNITCPAVDQPCACAANQVASADNTSCVAVSHVGGVCSRNEECLTNGECGGGGTCSCKANYFASSNNDICVAVSHVGGGCSRNEECLTNGECDTGDSKCICKANYVASSDNATCLSYVGGECNSDDNCLDNGACGGDKKCSCKANYFASNNNSTCVAVYSVGQTCSVDIECLANGECGSDKKCSCKASYVASKDSSKCEINGAASLLASLVFVVGVLMTSRLV